MLWHPVSAGGSGSSGKGHPGLGSIHDAVPLAQEIRSLPLPDLAIKLLSAQDQEFDLRRFLRLAGGDAYVEARPSDYQALRARVSDAWAWLEAHGLIGPAVTQGANWRRATAAGVKACTDPRALTEVWADERLAGDLAPGLSTARSTFALGDYETACFAAMKAVEVAVREAADLPNEVIGVTLMRNAFNPEGGPLSDPGTEKGEQQATMDLFAGAIGAYKNPTSHRTVEFQGALEAAEIIQLADLLLRVVSRARSRREARLAHG